MANAKKEVVTKTTVTLELSLEEAEALAEVCMHIGGCPDKSPRGQMQAISSALIDENVFRNGAELEGSIYFRS